MSSTSRDSQRKVGNSVASCDGLVYKRNTAAMAASDNLSGRCGTCHGVAFYFCDHIMTPGNDPRLRSSEQFIATKGHHISTSL